jgi:hypothetical protein
MVLVELYQGTVCLGQAINSRSSRCAKDLGICRLFFVLVGVAAIRLNDQFEVLIRVTAGVNLSIDLNG